MPAPGYGVEALAISDMRPRIRTGTGITTVHGRARSSMASGCTRWGPKGSCIAWSLGSGKPVWKRDLRADYKVRQDFFGTASTPLVEGKLLIVNVGAPGGPCVAGLDKATGREAWRAGKQWGPSYASPVPAVIHGKRRVFVFAGGESKPPTGGLMSIDPATGNVDFAFPWRSRSYESVNASCPVVFDNKVFISASYRKGSALLELRPDFTHRVVWRRQDFGLHFNTAIHREGYLYGFDGAEPTGRITGVPGSGERESGVERDSGMDREVRGERQAAAATPGNVPGIAAGGGRAIPVPGGVGTSAMDGSDTEGLQGGVADMAVRGARVLGAASAQPGPPVCGAEHSGHDVGGRSAAAVLRPEGVEYGLPASPTGGPRRHPEEAMAIRA